VRSAAYWKVAELFDPRNPECIGVPDDPRLKEELVGLKYKEVTGGRIQIEPKDQVIKRLGRSPDRADALAMAVYGQSRGGKVAVAASAGFAKVTRTDRERTFVDEVFN
jgi:hypothetical protein